MNYYNFPMRFIAVEPVKRNIDFKVYFNNLQGEIEFDEWGGCMVINYRLGGLLIRKP